MAKIKLVTCDSGFDLYNHSLTFMAWTYEIGLFEFIVGDVVFEVDEENVEAIASSFAYYVDSGSTITVLEVIEE